MNEFIDEVRNLWRAKGRPSLRSMSADTDHRVSHAAIGEIINGTSFPRWNTAVVLIEALNGDPNDFRDMWDAEAEAQQARRIARHGRGPRPRPRLAAGVVVRPGDTLVFTAHPTARQEDLEDLMGTLTEAFPNNPVRVVLGAELAVLAS